jgi:hypothetical protein
MQTVWRLRAFPPRISAYLRKLLQGVELRTALQTGRKRQAETGRDRKRQEETARDRKRQEETGREEYILLPKPTNLSPNHQTSPKTKKPLHKPAPRPTPLRHYRGVLSSVLPSRSCPESRVFMDSGDPPPGTGKNKQCKSLGSHTYTHKHTLDPESNSVTSTEPEPRVKQEPPEAR